MSNQNETQAIILAVRDEFRIHAAKTEAFQERTNKLIDAHSQEIWGTDDENPGLKAKVRDMTKEREREREARIWWRGAIGIPIIGLSIDKLITIFTTVHK